ELTNDLEYTQDQPAAMASFRSRRRDTLPVAPRGSSGTRQNSVGTLARGAPPRTPRAARPPDPGQPDPTQPDPTRRCRRPCQTRGDGPVRLYQTETWHHRAGRPDPGYGPLPCLHSRM